MKIEQIKTIIYRVDLTEDEVEALISSLSIAKADWNTTDIANEVLSKLKKLRGD